MVPVKQLRKVIIHVPLIWLLLKNRDKLSSTYHRLLLGVCIADLLIFCPAYLLMPWHLLVVTWYGMQEEISLT